MIQRSPRSSGHRHRLSVTTDHVGERLDVFLSAQLDNTSRSMAAQLVRLGLVQVNGFPAKASVRVSFDDDIIVVLPPETGPPQPEMLPLDVVYEDHDILVVNKPAGMVVHPAPGHKSRTLVNAILARYPALSSGDKERPGIVHRLDKDTSGLLVIALHEGVREWLVAQFKTRAVRKEYIALVAGQPQESGLIDAPIGRHPTKRKRMAVVPGGRPASTEYEVIERFRDTSLVLARPLTGRTHQIRVHMDSIGHPVVGDATYGGRGHRRALSQVLARHFLHARRLEFRLESWTEAQSFEVALPADLQAALNYLRNVTDR